MTYPDVIAVSACDGFRLDLSFANGEKRRFDVRPLLHLPVFKRLQSAGYFERAHVENGTVVWDEQLDLSPDTLYLQGVPLPS